MVFSPNLFAPAVIKDAELRRVSIGYNEIFKQIVRAINATPGSLPSNEVDALAGTSGTPSSTNKYVTNSDSRLGGGSGLPGLTLATTVCVGDGVTDDAPALNTLVNTTMAGTGSVYFTPGKTYRLATAITIPVGVELWLPVGVTLLIDTVAVCLHCPIRAGLYQIFSYTNGGTILFSTTNAEAANKLVLAMPGIHTHWWGAKWDNSHDDTAAHNAAIAATTGLPVSGVTTARFAGPPIYWPAGVSKITDAIQVTDTIGIRIIGAGFWNTYINFTAGETGTATGGTTTTLVNSGKAWAVNQWGTGRWQAYIYAGTGAGQWGDIASNDATTLTFSTALGTAPDNTSQYAIAAKAILDLDGFFSGTLSDFQVMGVGYFRHGVKYYRRSSLSARGSSQGRIDRVSVGGNYLDSGWQFGGNDVTGEHGFQADLLDISKCQAFGKGATSGLFAAQRGYTFGDSTFGNALNFTADGCESVLNAYGVAVSATNLTWIGGTIQSSALADILLNQGNQGVVKFIGNRSEGSRMLLDSTSSESVGFTLSIDGWQFQIDQFKGRDLIALDYGPATVKFSQIRTASPTVITGTATAGSTTTLTDSAAAFSTATITYLGGSTTGLAGWDLQITGGTGVGQRTQITSNTGTQLTFPALAVALDATSVYQVMPRPRINVHSSDGHIEMDSCYFTGSPIETWVQSSDGFVCSWNAIGCAELDKDGNPVRRALGDMIFGSLDPRYAGGIAWAGSGLQPDARLTRLSAGVVGAGAFTAGTLTVAPFGTTPTGLASAVGGTTTYNYKLVAVDGAGNKALPSATFSTTTAPATLGGVSHVALYTASPPGIAATWYDILKDDGTGTFKLLARVPWYQMSAPFYDVGQQLTAYTLPVVDSTGTFSHNGKAGFFGVAPTTQAAAIASPTSDTVGTKAAIDAIRVALQNIGITA